MSKDTSLKCHSLWSCYSTVAGVSVVSQGALHVKSHKRYTTDFQVIHWCQWIIMQRIFQESGPSLHASTEHFKYCKTLGSRPSTYLTILYITPQKTTITKQFWNHDKDLQELQCTTWNAPCLVSICNHTLLDYDI